MILITGEDISLKKRMRMKEITYNDYKKSFAKQNDLIFEDSIGKRKVVIKIGQEKNAAKVQPDPKSFKMEGTTVWSFPQRGNWATHKGDYRGNWPPQLARNVILRYSKPQETILDQMCGSGTTLIECKLLGRNGIGIDINIDAIWLTLDRLNFNCETSLGTTQKTFLGDARYLNRIKDETIDLVTTHPPYANIIPYSKNKVDGNLSNVHSIQEYIKEMQKVAKESFRVLKPQKYTTILVGDTRKDKHHIPIAFRVMQIFLDEGFILKEDIIKHQWRCKATPFWIKRSIEYNFLLIMHEHLFVFRKPGKNENISKQHESMKWW